MTKLLVNKSYDENTLKYIRLERKYDTRFDGGDGYLGRGISILKPGLWNNSNMKDKPKVALVSYGYMLGRCLDVWQKLQATKYEVSLYNMCILYVLINNIIFIFILIIIIYIIIKK